MWRDTHHPKVSSETEIPPFILISGKDVWKIRVRVLGSRVLSEKCQRWGRRRGRGGLLLDVSKLSVS